MTTELYTPPKPGMKFKYLEDFYVDPYLEWVLSSYNSPAARATLGIGNQKVSKVDGRFAAGSSFIDISLLYQDPKNIGLLPNGMMHVDRPGLETALETANATETKSDFLKEVYAECGIGIWSAPEKYKPNKTPWKILIKQFRKRKIDIGTGKLIPFSAFEKPREHNDTDYGLVLDLKDVSTRELNLRDIEEFEWIIKKGYGMVRAYFGGAQDWYCDYVHLATSSSGGVVVGVGVDAQKN